MRLLFASVVALLTGVIRAQHVGRVGPTVPASSKVYECNVLNFGAKADNITDVGPAIKSAFNNCIVKNPNSRLIIPQGNYLLSSTVLLNGGSNWAFQLDGLITLDYSAYLSGSVSGNALVFQRMNEFELYSSNGKGAMYGYLYRSRPNQSGRSGWPRLLHVYLSSNFSVHDIKLVDAPSFHLVVGEATNAEVYRITIRGGNQGGLDGVDISGTNYHVHHVEVTNRDECVTNAFMLKTYPGGASPGYVKNVLLRNFTNIDVTYNAYITQYWQNSYAAGAPNVQLSNITFSNWRGSVNNGANRGAVVMIGSETNPPVNINVNSFSFWTVEGNKMIDRCSSTYGSGSCIKSLSANVTPAKYATVSITATSAPTGWVKPSAPWGIPPYDLHKPIPIPTSTFY
ncbi:unnamed protein product [Rhizoctonia solani]|uniref:Uncharacterized protein n=1 Tax=Rhizoctonia solani TaxID=456999 RepID=A0A8H3H6H5_9AGAM|nr:unnamed protein product [Rhizoctonia solani]